MISAHDEAVMRRITEEKKPDVPPTPERLADCLPFLKGIKEPSEAQKRLWRQRQADREREALERQLLRPFRAECGRRLDPWTTTIDSFELWGSEENVAAQKTVIDLVRAYLVELKRHRKEGNGVFLIGAPGTGKDHLAVAIAREYILRLHCTARRVFCPDMRAALRDSYKNNGEREGGILRRMFTPDVLILSDPVSLGTKLSDAQQELIFKVVDKRNGAKKPTIVTANFQDEAEAKSVLGAQVVSRLSQGGLRLLCNWEDFRTRKGT